MFNRYKMLAGLRNPEGVMKWRCPQPDKARGKGCLDIKEDGWCIRKEWSGDITYFKDNKLNTFTKGEVYCERIKDILHEE